MTGSNDTPRSGWRRPSVILAALALSFALYTLLRPTRPPAPTEAEPNRADSRIVSEFSGVATVSDGDTIRIGPRRFQLDGIAAPARRVTCGGVDVYRGATDALRAVTRSQTVTCRLSDQPDAEGQSRARCSVDDIDLNAYMVENGWARDRSRGGVYAQQETAARAAERGVWSPSCPADLWRGSAD